ncbi:uncharacterized protein LOC120187962 [Hibiscus syriacus]|uniref:uncharacterized protein LOC120187962 n=1 Tax=Hibiscus syriacus TaxID=106335 RepID=UPI001923A7A8|nr:uncharacterized protein LOC120187962 [Hibiscus syriacus]
MKRLKPLLREFNKSYFSDISSRVIAKRAELESIQIYNLGHVDRRRVAEEKMVQAELIELETAESEFYRQKAKAHWLKEGDMSTKFFHQRVESNKKKNTIIMIKDENGEFHESFDGIASELVNFFKGLIGTPDPLVKGCSVEWLKSLLDYSLPDGADVSLVGEITDKEIKEALFIQEKDKSPGPDGYTSWFFKVAWEIVCKDFLNAIRYSISLNGSLVGYFLGARGVRQGDPLSPYLFVIVMNVLSVLLNVAARDCVFRFHPKWKKICLTHLCFADDLLLFCHGSLDSVMGVVSILDRFYELSGLRLNAMKSEFFACGVSVNSLLQIRLATSFKISQLPVRYLGVPLVTQKLTSRDCSALLIKIKSRIDVWSSMHLSFGGRLQLVKSVLFSIFGYWSRQLVLPKGVIKDIEKLCGMGQRKLTDWSKACCLMLVRKILVDDGSLWIAWIKGYCFKTMDYWNVGCKTHFSWILRKLLKLRDEARRLFWSAINLTRIKDGWIWDNVCDRRDKVDWHRLIWFAAHIPKFSIIAWMVILDRLPTKDILVRFGMVTDNVCGLCGVGQESSNHLFLECSYATEVWGAILQACGLQLQVLHCWNDALRWLILNLKAACCFLSDE